MASGLQCPGCGHVHPAGLPEIVRGDATFRCYGCYRTLSVPDGWSGRPTPRPPDLTVTGDAPAGAGTRDARTARLSGRGRARSDTLSGPGHGDLPTQMVPPVPLDDGAADDGWTGAAAAAGAAGTATGWPPSGVAGGGRAQTAGDRPGALATKSRAGAAPLGWVAPRRTGAPLPTAIRAGVWVGAFGFGLLVSAFILRKMGILDVNRVIDLYAGSGPGRFGVLLLLLPMWALLSATVAHLSLEGLAKRRQTRAASPRPPANSTSPSPER